MLFVEQQKCKHVANSNVEWDIDFAASHHVIPTKGLFIMYEARDFSTVKMGNLSYPKIVEIGNVCIETNVGSIVMLNDVRHVPDLRMNASSTLTMD